MLFSGKHYFQRIPRTDGCWSSESCRAGLPSGLQNAEERRQDGEWQEWDSTVPDIFSARRTGRKKYERISGRKKERKGEKEHEALKAECGTGQ